MSAIPSRFYALFLRARYAHVVRSALPCVATATVLRHYTALTRAPNLGACFVHAQNKRRGLALKVVPGSSWRFSLVLDSSHCVTNSFLETLLRFASRFHISQVAVGAQRDRH